VGDYFFGGLTEQFSLTYCSVVAGLGDLRAWLPAFIKTFIQLKPALSADVAQLEWHLAPGVNATRRESLHMAGAFPSGKLAMGSLWCSNCLDPVFARSIYPVPPDLGGQS